MTLVEVLFASSIFVLIIASVLGAVMVGLHLNYAAAQQFAAFGLCKDRYEQMRSVDYTNVSSTVFTTETIQLTHMGGNARVPLNCQRASFITNMVSPTRKQVTINVQWTYLGKARSESLTGVIYKKQ